jgi:membrane-bound metal-dependent hydrolase YbcI (DUF457 family)
VAGGHRGPTHSLLGLAVTAAIGLLLQATLAWWALPRGVLAHLMLDTLTGGGGPWLWPWRKHLRAQWALHTGSGVGHGGVFPLLLAMVAVEGMGLM